MAKTEKPQHLDICACGNCEAEGHAKETYRDFTDAEIAELEQREKEAAERKALQDAETKNKAEAKASALAKLAALGLSEEEAKAIAG